MQHYHAYNSTVARKKWIHFNSSCGKKDLFELLNVGDFIEVDDMECINFILNHLPEELQGKVSDDDIQYVLDLICEYYAANDLIEEDTVEEATIAEEDMFNFIMAAIRKEKIIDIDEYTLEVILDGEFEYGKTIGIYTEEE